MTRKFVSLTLFAAGFAAGVVAQVSPQHRNWGKTAVHNLMMKQEKTDWASVKTDADAKALIDIFCARRDPTPDTPA